MNILLLIGVAVVGFLGAVFLLSNAIVGLKYFLMFKPSADVSNGQRGYSNLLISVAFLGAFAIWMTGVFYLWNAL